MECALWVCVRVTPAHPHTLTGYSVTGEKEPMEKFENEDEMLSRYEIHMKLLQMFKDLPSNRNWRNMMETDYCTQHMKVCSG